eukprot:366550-Chlamydomonas_euryale.AAC.10
MRRGETGPGMKERFQERRDRPGHERKVSREERKKGVDARRSGSESARTLEERGRKRWKAKQRVEGWEHHSART